MFGYVAFGINSLFLCCFKATLFPFPTPIWNIVFQWDFRIFSMQKAIVSMVRARQTFKIRMTLAQLSACLLMQVGAFFMKKKSIYDYDEVAIILADKKNLPSPSTGDSEGWFSVHINVLDAITWSSHEFFPFCW